MLSLDKNQIILNLFCHFVSNFILALHWIIWFLSGWFFAFGSPMKRLWHGIRIKFSTRDFLIRLKINFIWGSCKSHTQQALVPTWVLICWCKIYGSLDQLATFQFKAFKLCRISSQGVISNWFNDFLAILTAMLVNVSLGLKFTKFTSF